MTDDDRVYIFCHRITELADPTSESITKQCEWPGCHALMWVHPHSIEIALDEHGVMVCIQHMDAVAAADPDPEGSYLLLHPLQAPEHQDMLRSLGAITREEAEERRARRRR